MDNQENFVKAKIQINPIHLEVIIEGASKMVIGAGFAVGLNTATAVSLGRKVGNDLPKEIFKEGTYDEAKQYLFAVLEQAGAILKNQ